MARIGANLCPRFGVWSGGRAGKSALRPGLLLFIPEVLTNFPARLFILRNLSSKGNIITLFSQNGIVSHFRERGPVSVTRFGAKRSGEGTDTWSDPSPLLKTPAWL
jgi:hypothetical protein